MADPPQGPIGEAGATARTLIDALGASPVVLALVVVCLGLIGLLYWSASVAERERADERKLLYENRREVGQLLASCTMLQALPPPNRPH